jgi:chemotaxis protein methyltransferase CheR
MRPATASASCGGCRIERFLVSVPGTTPDAGGDEWQVAPALRSRVTVIRHNLATDAPPFAIGGCQIVFCRNVLIYFGHDDVVAFLDRLAAHLTSSGLLFLGYSESLWQVSDRFHMVRLGEAFVYRPGPKVGGVGARVASVAPPVSRASGASPPVGPVGPVPPRPERRARVRAVDDVVKEADDAPVTVAELLSDGEAALGRGDHTDAIAAFRKAAFVDPDHPLAHLNLGLALEVVGDEVSARRAFAAARAALRRGDHAAVESMLEGYHLDDLVRLLEQKAST